MNLRLLVRPSLVVLIAAVALIGCRSKDNELMISNVGGEEIIAISKARDQGDVSQLRLHIDGELQGAAQLILLKGTQPHHVEMLRGKVDVRWQGDWEADRARLHYVPGPAVGGTLRLRYRFVE